MTCLSNKDVKIRKDRKCFSCYRKFPKGTTMNYWVSIYEGDFCAVYCCLTCKEICNLVKEEDGYPEGYVGETLEKGQTPEQILATIKEGRAVI